eukprot:2788944-Karenia_brevis.AAC.1
MIIAAGLQRRYRPVATNLHDYPPTTGPPGMAMLSATIKHIYDCYVDFGWARLQNMQHCKQLNAL